MPTINRLALRGLAAAIGFALSAAVFTAGAATLKNAAQNDILTADPHSQNHATTNAILMHVYEGLTRYNAKFEVEPALATKWTYISPTQVRFELRKGVKFHDGTPFTADDVVFSFNRIKQPQGTMQIYIAGIGEVKKVDDYTVDFIMPAPNPILLRNIIDFRIMSKSWSEKNKVTNIQDYKAKEETYASRNAMGTGPYMWKAWAPEQRIEMVENPNWWGKKDGNVTAYTYLPIKADATRISALIAGDIDMSSEVPPQDVERLKKDPKLKVLEGIEVRTIFLGMDQWSDEAKYTNVKGKNPFKDKRVREALSLAVDREAIKKSIMRGLSVPAGIIVAPGVNGHSNDIDKAEFNVEKAKKLLAEAGYPNGFELTLDCPNNRYVNDEKVCQAVVAMWAKIGLKPKLNSMNFAPYIAKIQNFDTSVYMLGWGVATYDALYSLQSLVRTKTTGADGNFNLGRINDTRLDAIIDQLKTEPDVTKRNALIRRALERTKEEAYYVTLHHQIRPWAMKKEVTTLHRSDDRPEARFAKVSGGGS